MATSQRAPYRQPARSHLGIDSTNLSVMRDILSKHGVGFIPPTPAKLQRIQNRRKELNLSLIYADSLENVILNIKHKHDPVNDKSYMYGMYLNRSGDIETIRVSQLRPLESIHQQNKRIYLYDYDIVKRANPGSSKDLASGNPAINLRARIRMPDIICGQIIDPETLHQVIQETRVEDIDTSGLTASEYIYSMYARRMFIEFMVNGIFIDYEHSPKIYADIGAYMAPHKYDNWQGERLDSSHSVFTSPPDPTAYDVLTKINTPRFEREPGNRNTKTFDRIRIYLGIKSKSACPTRDDLIHKHKRDLVKIALIKIEQNNKFQTYGVPIQYLKPSHMTVTCSDEIEIVFELKEV